MVVDEKFALRLPENLPLATVAPLLCARTTTYIPQRYFGLDKPGMKVGMVGLGGLGNVAVKMAKAFETEVTTFSSTPGKKQEALEDQEHMQLNQSTLSSLDGIIDTVSATHQLRHC
ncbi:hypothetical protein L1887_21183 [Cichorium endivia]|nr:hypothetical protein L1887_21183 [Cichorium endivia]